MIRCVPWIVLLVAATPITACAAGAPGPLLLQLAGLLAIIGLLAVGAAWTTLRQRAHSRGHDRQLAILARRPLGPRQQILALTAGDRVLIVATAPQRTELLTEMPRRAWRAAHDPAHAQKASDAERHACTSSHAGHSTDEVRDGGAPSSTGEDLSGDAPPSAASTTDIRTPHDSIHVKPEYRPASFTELLRAPFSPTSPRDGNDDTERA